MNYLPWSTLVFYLGKTAFFLKSKVLFDSSNKGLKRLKIVAIEKIFLIFIIFKQCSVKFYNFLTNSDSDQIYLAVHVKSIPSLF